jgi:hypothetical protein
VGRLWHVKETGGSWRWRRDEASRASGKVPVFDNEVVKLRPIIGNHSIEDGLQPHHPPGYYSLISAPTRANFFHQSYSSRHFMSSRHAYA